MSLVTFILLTNFAKLLQEAGGVAASPHTVGGSDKPLQIEGLVPSLDKIAEQLTSISDSLQTLTKETAKISETLIHITKHEKALKAEAHLENAAKALDASVFDTAFAEFRKAEELAPANYQIWLGYVYIRCKLVLNQGANGSQAAELFGSRAASVEEDIYKATKFIVAETDLSRENRLRHLLNLLAASAILEAGDSRVLVTAEISKLIRLKLSGEKLDVAVKLLKPLLLFSSDERVAVNIEPVRQQTLAIYQSAVENCKHNMFREAVDLYYTEREWERQITEIKEAIDGVFDSEQLNTLARITESIKQLAEQKKIALDIQAEIQNLEGERLYQFFGDESFEPYISNEEIGREFQESYIPFYDKVYVFLLVFTFGIMALIAYIFSTILIPSILAFGIAILIVWRWLTHRRRMRREIDLYFEKLESLTRKYDEVKEPLVTQVRRIFEEHLNQKAEG